MSSETIPLGYIKQKLDQGFDLDWIAKDLGIQLESLKRRITRAKERGDW